MLRHVIRDLDRATEAWDLISLTIIKGKDSYQIITRMEHFYLNHVHRGRSIDITHAVFYINALNNVHQADINYHMTYIYNT